AAAQIKSGDLSGERVTPSWMAGGGDDDVTQYSFDLLNLGSCGGGGGNDGGSVGDGGVGGTVFRTVSAGGSRQINTSVDLGLAAGEGALFAVRAVDPAGNVGEV